MASDQGKGKEDPGRASRTTTTRRLKAPRISATGVLQEKFGDTEEALKATLDKLHLK